MQSPGNPNLMEYDPRKVLTVGLRDYNRVVWLVLRFQPENRIESALLGLVHTIVVLIKRGKKKEKAKIQAKTYPVSRYSTPIWRCTLLVRL